MSDQVLLQTPSTVAGFKVGDKLVRKFHKTFLGPSEDYELIFTIYEIRGASLYTKNQYGNEYRFQNRRTKTVYSYSFPANSWRSAGEAQIVVYQFIRA
jgi:hypothetical protein